jgi:hypothetical protein
MRAKFTPEETALRKAKYPTLAGFALGMAEGLEMIHQASGTALDAIFHGVSRGAFMAICFGGLVFVPVWFYLMLKNLDRLKD